MDPATRILSHQSTRSYLERELIVTLDDNGPMIGPTLEMVDTHQDEQLHPVHEESMTSNDTITKKWWQRKKKPADVSDPKKFPKMKKNIILLLVAIGGAM